MSKIIEVEVYCKNNAATSTTLKLPATLFEIADAFDKLHMTDTKSIYQMEILSCKPDYLSPHISESINLYDLNHLAQRLNAMSDWELDCFEGMVQMDTEKAKSIPILPERLINLTHSTADCQIAFEAHNDRELGKFYVEGGMSDIPDDLPQSVYELLDYEAIGKKARIAEGGVFTEKGYVVLSGEVSQDYHEGNAVPQEKPSHAIMLEVCKDFFDDDNHSEYLTLPANDGMIARVLGQLNAASVEECSFRRGPWHGSW